MIYNNPDVNGNSCDEDTSLSVDTVSDDNVIRSGRIIKVPAKLDL